jgi:hypothetical protein
VRLAVRLLAGVWVRAARDTHIGDRVLAANCQHELVSEPLVARPWSTAVAFANSHPRVTSCYTLDDERAESSSPPP